MIIIRVINVEEANNGEVLLRTIGHIASFHVLMTQYIYSRNSKFNKTIYFIFLI